MLGESDSPEVAGNFQFDADLEQFPHCAWALNPHHSSTHRARLAARLRMWNLQHDPHGFEDVVLRLVAATVATDGDGGGALLEGPAESIHPGYGQRQGLNDARTAAVLWISPGIGSGVGHQFTSPYTRTATRARVWLGCPSFRSVVSLPNLLRTGGGC